MRIGWLDNHLNLWGGGRRILPREDLPRWLDGGLEDSWLLGLGDGGGRGAGDVNLGFDAVGPINQTRLEMRSGGDVRAGFDEGRGMDVETGLYAGWRGAKAGDRAARAAVHRPTQHPHEIEIQRGDDSGDVRANFHAVPLAKRAASDNTAWSRMAGFARFFAEKL
jgi:hypothetical protein